MADDGVFWISWTDFKYFFDMFQIIKTFKDFQLSSYIAHKGYSGVHLIEVPEDGQYTFSISQVGTRMFDKKTAYYISPSRQFLLKIPDGIDSVATSKEVHFVGANLQKQACERENHLETEISAGQYLLFTQIDWHRFSHDIVDDTYTVNCYSKEPVTFEDVTSKVRTYDMLKAATDASLEDRTD